MLKKSRRKLIKEITPLWYKYFSFRNKEHKFRNLTTNAFFSFSFAFLNSTLTKLIALKSSLWVLAIPTLCYYIVLLFSTKTMAFADNIGKIVFVLFSTLGFLSAVYLLL